VGESPDLLLLRPNELRKPSNIVFFGVGELCPEEVSVGLVTPEDILRPFKKSMFSCWGELGVDFTDSVKTVGIESGPTDLHRSFWCLEGPN